MAGQLWPEATSGSPEHPVRGQLRNRGKWIAIRRRVPGKEISKRQACLEYGIGWRTLEEVLTHEEPPSYQQKQPRRKLKLEQFLSVIHGILEADRQAPKKQRHTAQRIFDRLVDEHGYHGGVTIVKESVRCGSANARAAVERARSA